MELLQPERLAWLLLLPLLYFLSRPPRPRRSQLTAHLAQWLRARRRLRRQPVRFRWLRFLLLVLAFSCVVVAHSEPQVIGRAGASSLVILVDCSASMTATDAAGVPAWRRARDATAALLAEVPAHVDVRIGLCGTGVEVVRGTREDLRRAMAAAQPVAAGRVDLSRLAAHLSDADTAVWTVTDALGGTEPPSAGGLRIVGSPGDNVAITACTVEDAWPLPEIVLRVRVANFGAVSRQVQLAATGGVAAPIRRGVRLEPAASRELRLELRRTAGGPLAIRLVDAGDTLAVDDEVTVHLPAPPRPDIVVRSVGPVPAALAAVARTLAEDSGGRVVDGASATRAGFLLMDGGTLGSPLRGVRLLSFGTALGVERGSTVTSPRVSGWDRFDPITAGLDLSELLAYRALPFPDVGGSALVDGDRGPLIWLRQDAASASIHAAFRLEDSNFGNLAAFPQFVRRCFARSYGRKASPLVDPVALLDPTESRLARQSPAILDRPLRDFVQPPTRLIVPLLILALLALAIRAYV